MKLFTKIREAFVKDPAISVSIAIGITFPSLAFILKPLREKYWYPDRFVLPTKYPLPMVNGTWKRTEHDSFDDEEFYLLVPGRSAPKNRVLSG